MSPSVDDVNYPKSLVLTDDSNLEDVLSDVPFLSVGILSLGTLFFFIVVRKPTIAVICLHVSMQLAFIGGITDVIQTLRKGDNYSVSHGTDLTTVVLPKISQIALSLSVAFRFVFFWAFVGQPIFRKRIIIPFKDTFDMSGQSYLIFAADSLPVISQSTSWKRWGLSGVLSKWSLLALCSSVAVLQGIWRLDNNLSRNSIEYIIESTVEIVLSALFILILLANIWLCPLTPRWKTFRDHSLFLLSLAINMSLGVGNVFLFQLSESVLGRFLQAVELTILSASTLIRTSGKKHIEHNVIEGQIKDYLKQKSSLGSDNAAEEGLVGTPELKSAVLFSGTRVSDTTTCQAKWFRAEDSNQAHDSIGPSVGRESAAEFRPSSTSPTKLNTDKLADTPLSTNLYESQEIIMSRPASVHVPIKVASLQATSTSSSVETIHPDVHYPHIYSRRTSTGTIDQRFLSRYMANTSISRRASDEISANSSALDNISRHQEELERSLAELRYFFPEGVSRGSRTANSHTRSLSKYRRPSSVSLSSFPSPAQLDNSSTGSNMISPLMRNDKRQPESFMSSNPVCVDESYDFPFASGYNVTSFIGNLSRPPDGNGSASEVSLQSDDAIYESLLDTQLVSSERIFNVGDQRRRDIVPSMEPGEQQSYVATSPVGQQQTMTSGKSQARLRPIMLPRGGKIKAAAGGTSVYGLDTRVTREIVEAEAI